MSALLEVRQMQAFYGPTRVLRGIDFVVESEGITTILGTNGAGKTTTLRAISRMIRTTGEIYFEGQRIDGLATEAVARLGIGHVPDGRGTFLDMTVEENLQIGAYTRKDKTSLKQDFDKIFDYFPRLRERRSQQAGTLSGGEQQMLAIGRALMLRPKLLLLDEPSFGLAPIVIREIFAIMKQLNQDEKLSVLLVEQNVHMALDLAQQAYLLETGSMVLSGTSELFRQDKTIQHSYLGI